MSGERRNTSPADFGRTAKVPNACAGGNEGLSMTIRVGRGSSSTPDQIQTVGRRPPRGWREAARSGDRATVYRISGKVCRRTSWNDALVARLYQQIGQLKVERLDPEERSTSHDLQHSGVSMTDRQHRTCP